MYVGLAKISVVIADSHSLKDKRMVIRRIKDRVRDKVGVVVNEVGNQDVWQRAELGCAVTSGDRGKAHELLDQVIRVAMAAGGAEIAAVAKDVWTYDAEPAPLAVIDPVSGDRTGAADKAVAGDDWVPLAWRDEP